MSNSWPIGRPYHALPLLAKVDLGAIEWNEGILCILQSSSHNEALPSDCFVLCPGHSLEKTYSSAKMQLMYSAGPPGWAKYWVKEYLQILLSTLSIYRWKKKTDIEGYILNRHFFSEIVYNEQFWICVNQTKFIIMKVQIISFQKLYSWKDHLKMYDKYNNRSSSYISVSKPF